MYAIIQDCKTWMVAMLRDVVRRRRRYRRRWAHAPVIHAASHFCHEKRVAWVSISITNGIKICITTATNR